MRYLLVMALMLMILSTPFAQTEQTKVDYLSNNGFGNSVIGHAGEYYDGITYIAYQGPLEDAYVAAYDHKANSWVGPYKAGISTMGKTAGKKIDNHGKPTLVVDSQGYIHLVFGGHGGTPDLGKNRLGNYHDGKQMHVVSKRPKDITEWEVVDNITPFGTYSQFLKMDNGNIYLFYRHGAHRSNWVYQISKDDCQTFSPPVSIVLTKEIEGTETYPVQYDSWYLNFNRGNDNDIVVAFNYHLCKGPKHDGERHNAYYMKFDTDSQEWLNVKGEKLKLPITKEYADEMALVRNSGERWTHNGMAAVDKKGRPQITSYEGAHDGLKHGGPKDLMHYYWNGEDWLGGNVGLPTGAKGYLQASKKQEINLLVHTKVGKTTEVAKWKSASRAEKFKKAAVLLPNKSGRILLSKMIRNAHPNARFLAAEKIKGSNYTKMYLIGAQGPIERLQIEADIAKK